MPLFLGAKVVQKLIPTDVLIECDELADAAEARGKEDVGLGIARFAFIAILTSRLLAVVRASALVKVFIHH